MRLKNLVRLSIILLTIFGTSATLFLGFQYLSRAASTPANIRINTKKVIGRVPTNWKALAQGGEEKGVRMLQNVVPQVAQLTPQYIRLDHIYDFYDVASRNNNGSLVLNWSQLDATVCDILATGAKPFFALGYMPSVMSVDGSPIGQPTNWNEWAYLVQKTIERYSGQATVLCGNQSGNAFLETYYEVWNEPDLEIFGSWKLYGGDKDYKTLYYYSSLGASQAQNVQRFYLGGPVTTALYKNWITVLLDYIMANNLRIDFLSWHHYTKTADDFTTDMINLDSWLSDPKYANYRYLPKIISEWGYDPAPNPISDTNIGAAHTVASLRNFINTGLTYGFSFEVKDGPAPRWGILGYDTKPKPRYHALKFVNRLQNFQLQTEGEGTHVRAIASAWLNKVTVVLVNYDANNRNTENVPVTFTNLTPGTYSLTVTYLDGSTIAVNTISVPGTELARIVLMQPNSVASIELTKK